MSSDIEEELNEMSLEDELIEYLIQRREEDLVKLTPKSKFKININEHPSLEKLLEYEKTGFRTTVRKAIIKAFSNYRFADSRTNLIVKTKEIFEDIQLEIRIPQSVNIEDIKAEKHERKIITFPCEVLAVEETETITTAFLFKCPECRDEQIFPPNSGRHVCGACHDDMRNEGVAESETVRTITVQNTNSADNTPILFTTDFHKELAGTIQINQKIMLTGLFKSIPPHSRTKTKNEILIDVINITPLEEDKTEIPDPLTLQVYKDLAKKGKLLDRLVKSYAWHIEGDEPLKLACLLYLARGVETENHRGRIHVFFLGDPSTAKSEIAKFMLRITPNSGKADGTGSSGAGLGAGWTTLPNGRTAMISGPLVKYRFVFINELDKMEKEHYHMFLGIMEEGRCMRTLAGVDIDLPAYTSIIADANPIGGQWDLDNPSVGANITLTAQMLSRADLLFRTIQNPNEENDRRIGRHIMKSRHERPKDIFSEEELTAYFNYIRELKPILTEEFEEKILDFFVKREKFQISRDSIPMDWRQYEALVRLSYAFAKLLLKPTVDEECVNRSIDIFKKAVASFGISLEDGGSLAEASKWFVNPKDKADMALNKTFKRMKEEKGDVFRDELVLEMTKLPQWKSEDHAHSTLNTWHVKGRLIEKPNGSIVLVD